MQTVTRYKALLSDLIERDIEARYRGSVFGLAWSLGQPLLLLCIYTWVFTVVFKARWSEGGTSTGELALLVFTGLILHGFLVDVIARAPQLIAHQAVYVKKVVFPLEVLPIAITGSALFHLLVSCMVLAGFELALFGGLPWTALLVPVVVAPFAVMVLGLAWILAAAGVYLRDITQVLGVVSTALMFLSPVLYPASALPEGAQGYLFLNPLTFAIEQTRDLMIWGRPPDLPGLLVYGIAASLIAFTGFAIFQRARSGFADVL